MAVTFDQDYYNSLLLKISNKVREFHAISAKSADILGLDVQGEATEEDANKLEYHLGIIERDGLVTFHHDPSGTWTVKEIHSLGVSAIKRLKP